MAPPAAKAMMPTSAPGSNELGRRNLCLAGFTLIEVVVVLLLMSIVSALVVANMAPDDKTALRMESEHLAAALEQASLDAHVSGKTIVWSTAGQGYRFQYEAPDGTWTLMNEGVYRPHQLPAGMQIQRITLDQSPLETPAQLVFRPSGINLPFHVTIGKQQLRMTIAGDVMNRATVEATADAP